MSKYLDVEGLKKFWSKIKIHVSDSVSKVEVKEIPWSIIKDKPDLAYKEDITNVYRYKGSVDSYESLQSEHSDGNEVGDVYDTVETGMNYAWTGDHWDPLGSSFQIEPISDQEIDEITGDE